jgi:hypothetical protein
VCESKSLLRPVKDWVLEIWDSSSDGMRVVEVIGVVLATVLLLGLCSRGCRMCWRERRGPEMVAGVLRSSFLGGSDKLPAAKLTTLDVQARWAEAELDGYPVEEEDEDDLLDVESPLRPLSSSAAEGATPRRRPEGRAGVQVMFTNEHIRELQPSNWKEEPLGHGTYGIVYKATWRGRDVAVKVMKLPERSAEATDAANAVLKKKVQEITKDFVTEVEICADLNHPNLVRLLGYADQPNLVLVHELLRGNSVDAQLYVENWQPTHRQILKVALDVAKGMDYLHTKFKANDSKHDQPIIHRDLKTPNLLLEARPRGDSEEGLLVKIADFGLSRDKGLDEANYSQTVLMTGCGSVLWMAPEILLGHKYNEKVDVFSYAMCLVEMVDCKLPWAGVTTGAEVPHKVTRGDRPDRQLDSCEDDLAELIRKCWSQSPRERPEFGEIAAQLKVMLGGRRSSSGGGSRTRRSSGSGKGRRARTRREGGLDAVEEAADE